MSSVLPGNTVKILEKTKLQAVCLSKNKEFVYYSAFDETIPVLCGEVCAFKAT